MSDINLIENVERNFTKKLFYMCDLPRVTYDGRLEFLDHKRFELRTFAR